MNKLAFLLCASLVLNACLAKRLDMVMAKDPNDPVYKAVDNVACALATQVQPTLNCNIATLPPEVQALAQAAFVAIDSAAQKAAADAARNLTSTQRLVAANAADDLASLAKILHEVLHDTSSPTLVQAPQE